MRIVSWNACRRGGLADEHLLSLKPDVAILPEWGRLPMSVPHLASSFEPFGKPGQYGLGVAAFGDWEGKRATVPAISGTVIGAVDVAGPSSFRLIAVWSYLSGNPKVNPVMEALEVWADWLALGPVVVAGDFNTGGWWTHIKTGPMSHFPIVAQLEAMGLHSAYHFYRPTEQGVDEEPTFWSASGGSYMIDHVFTPSKWPICEVAVGSEDPWRQRSDHAPLTVELGCPPDPEQNS